MRMILIYATKPELRPLTFVKDEGDVASFITQRLNMAEENYRGREEKAYQKGGNTSRVSIERWSSARWVEIELPSDVRMSPEPGTSRS